MMQKIGTIILDIQSCKNYGCVHRMRVLVQLCPRERVSLIKLKDMRINRMYLIIAGNCSAPQRITVGALDFFFFFLVFSRSLVSIPQLHQVGYSGSSTTCPAVVQLVRAVPGQL